jgi:CRISPR-associated protein Cmr3
MKTTWLNIDPIDIFIPRGNRLFGGGVHGKVAMPPWPSLFSGALISRALADAGRLGDLDQPEKVEMVLEQVLGPNYGLAWLGLEAKGKTYLPLPADLIVVSETGTDKKRLCRIRPGPTNLSLYGIASSNLLGRPLVFEYLYRQKPISGFWMERKGWKDYLANLLPETDTLISDKELWQVDPRLGIALDRGSRTVAEGDIYTTDTLTLNKGVTFLVGFNSSSIPTEGLIRLGGDGRGAKITLADPSVTNELQEMGKPQGGWSGFRMILITPGLFPEGWIPPGVDPESFIWKINGLVAKCEAALVSRPEVISGWDLVRESPKPAFKMVPAGSVYWFSVVEGDTASLVSVWEKGLWEIGCNQEYKARQREGFGRVWFGAWNNKEV